METTIYNNKYIKYKLKYLSLKNQQNGGACKKLTDEKYKKRPSPPYHANDCKGKIMNGNDQSQYISREDLNGVYHWKKLKNEYACDSAEEFYSQFKKYEPKYDNKDLLSKLDLVERDLLKSKIYLLYIGWKDVGNFIDDAWEEATIMMSKKLGKNEEDVYGNTEIMLYTEHKLFWSTIKGELPIEHRNIAITTDRRIIDIFTKYFDKSVLFPKDPDKPIIIKLHKL